MKSELERACEEHAGEMALGRTVISLFQTVLTCVITLKVFGVI